MEHSQSPPTLLDAFLRTAHASTQAERNRAILQLGVEQWTYAEMDTISNGIANELEEKYGKKPTVAIVSENHPFLFGIILATWKLNGIVATLDWNVPEGIMNKMLENIKPSVVVFPEGQVQVLKLAQGSSIIGLRVFASSDIPRTFRSEHRVSRVQEGG